MEITLRKAAVLQNSINESIKNLNFESKIDLNEFQDPEFEINQKLEKFKTDLCRRAGLISVLYEIRKNVGRANNDSGINDRLSDVAHLEKEIQFYTQISSNALRIDEKVLTGKLEKIRNRKDESRASIYGRDDEVTTSILTSKEVEEFKKLLKTAKKSKQKIQDEILELNVKTTISLSENAEKILKEESII
jgi:ribosomal protein L25 (general stress protein Ctc)